MIIDTRINGIPCKCEVTHFVPATPMYVYGPGMGDADAPQESEIEYQILDRRGKPAAWLEIYLTPQVEELLYEEINAAMTAERHCYEY